jgi:pyruvyl transferase EpsO
MMNDLSTPRQIQAVLRQRLAPELGSLKSCSLLEFSKWSNAGIHILWLGGVSYLLDIARTNITYISSIRDFSSERLAQQADNSPLVIRAGALTDGWAGTTECVDFYKQLISAYQDRPVIILPRSISFQSQARLREMAKIFNTHPQLTLLVRDKTSYALAQEHLTCRTVLTPDIAFQLADDLESVSLNTPTDNVLFLRRTDWPANPEFAPENLGLSNFVVQDWNSYQHKKLPFRVRGLNRILRDVWFSRLAVPDEWRSRRDWMHSGRLNVPLDHRFRYSWKMLHRTIYQLQQYRLVVTNRLHAHILCVLLGIPNVVLPGPHGNTDVIFQSWTKQIPYCRFATKAKEVQPLARELLEKFPTPYRPVPSPSNQIVR